MARCTYESCVTLRGAVFLVESVGLGLVVVGSALQCRDCSANYPGGCPLFGSVVEPVFLGLAQPPGFFSMCKLSVPVGTVIALSVAFDWCGSSVLMPTPSSDCVMSELRMPSRTGLLYGPLLQSVVVDRQLRDEEEVIGAAAVNHSVAF